jgi:hypothetical protein
MEDGMTDPNDDELAALRDVSRDLPALDVDPAAADRIARAARGGRPLRRVIEVAVVAMLAASLLGWAVYKVLELLR